ncbi:MAG: DUF4432 family protein [Bacteroidales bacterium]|nr:DUF4432 family protein [Bacteroidales bacterium]
MGKDRDIHFSNKELYSGAEDIFIEKDNHSISLFHFPGDPENMKRLKVETGLLSIEFLPARGMTPGKAVYDDLKIFWDPPAEFNDPDNFDPFSDEICINGKPATGFSMLKTLYGGIELYGLKNWGMPVMDANQQILYPLHGEASNIPVDYITIIVDKETVIIKTELIYRDIYSGDKNGKWYENGESLYKIFRLFLLDGTIGDILVRDRITNVSSRTLNPDWGYHITLNPEPASRLIVPSESMELRRGGSLPDDPSLWLPANDDKVREETGIIHKSILQAGPEKLNPALLVYPDDTGILIETTPAPYYQTWFCRGGRSGKEFTWKENGLPVFDKNWDGQGIEIGSSALDHDGNTDPSVNYKNELEPGESIEIQINISVLDSQETLRVRESFDRGSD